MRTFLVLFREIKLILQSHPFMWILHVTCLSSTLTSCKRQHMVVLHVISSNSDSHCCLSQTACKMNLLWASGHLCGAIDLYCWGAVSSVQLALLKTVPLECTTKPAGPQGWWHYTLLGLLKTSIWEKSSVEGEKKFVRNPRFYTRLTQWSSRCQIFL